MKPSTRFVGSIGEFKTPLTPPPKLETRVLGGSESNLEPTMRVDPKTLLITEMTDLEAAAMLEWTEAIVLAGTFPPDDPPWLAEWLRVAGFDGRQRLMVLSTVVPQRALLSLLNHRVSEDFRAFLRNTARKDNHENELAKLRDRVAEFQTERDDARRAWCEAEAANPGEGMVSEPGDPDNDPVTYATRRWGAEEALRLFPPAQTIDPHVHPLLAELAKIAVDLTPQERDDLHLLCSVPPGTSTYVTTGPELVGKDLARRESHPDSARVAYEAIPRGRLLVLLPPANSRRTPPGAP